LVLAATVVLHAQVLTNFGYQNMSSKSSQPLLIILVNFTNNATPFAINKTPIGTNSALARNHYENWVFNPTNQTESVNGFFRESSNNRFTWSRAGLVYLEMDASDTYEAVAARCSNPDQVYLSNIVRRVMPSGQFDFNAFDTNANDGTVTGAELSIAEISNDQTFGGGARGSDYVPGGSAAWNGSIAMQQCFHSLGVICHELVHILEGGKGGDIYGERSLSDRLTVMGGDTDGSHADAWHKLQFGWSDPRMVSLRTGGRFDIPAAQLQNVTAPIILYDTDGPNGLKEFFLLEYRTSSLPGGNAGYEWNVPGSGLAVWHIQHAANNAAKNYVEAAMPFAERNWAMCLHCCGVYQVDSAGRCPSTNSTHESNGPNVIHVLAKNDPDALGDASWRRCLNCRQLFYFPRQAQSVCPSSGNPHVAGTDMYTVPIEGQPDTMGRKGYERCVKCEVLWRLDDYFTSRHCAAGGDHARSATNFAYGVTTTGALAMMTEGATNFLRGGSRLWTGGTTTPRLRWYRGGEIPCRLRVLPFGTAPNSITVEILTDSETWVDFAYGGIEVGSIAQPFNTFGEGVQAVGYDGVLHIKAGTSSETRHVTKAMKIESSGGAVKIGRQ
jgi:M6 family metalloprotease-like protein